MLFQIALVAFAVFALTKISKQYQARKISKYWLLVVGLFWVAVAVVAIIPETTNIAANFVGVGRGADLLVYSGLVVLSYIVHRLILRQQQLSDEITELVRQAALDKPKIPPTVS
jgi:hypothetical protein